ncbi:MAG: helix-hairpin-helix domain-containing protein [Tannerella sp.]|nr:helix-hairpin-helix domain-containing protein [Tannerella sp.]
MVAGILLIKNDKPVQMKDAVTVTAGDASVDNAQKQNPAHPSSDSLKRSGAYESERSSVSPGNLQSEKKSASTETAAVAENKKETVPERVKRITSYSRPSYPRIEKFEKGVVVELNTADTVILKKVPGIGSSYARRIVGYRNLLGGYYSVMQLSEVYGMDEDRYNALAPWFTADPSLISKLQVNELSQDSLRRHPYISYSQAKILTQLRRQKGKLTGWENLQLLNEFTENDKLRLQYYLSFE